jgi:hypothetical protein
MHPDTVGGSKISADYPGVLARLMANYHGKDCVTLYGNGTCGNLNHIDTSWARAQKGPEEASRIGTLLAASIFRSEKSQKPLAAGAVRVKSVTVPLDVPFVSKEQEEMAQQTVSGKSAAPAPAFMQLVHANRLLDLAARAGEPIPAEVQVITLGRDVAWIGLPGEVFVELGLALKKRSPFPHTIITTLTNGNWGYIPDRRSYAEKAYEAESARVEPGSGEKLVDAAAGILAELYSSNDSGKRSFAGKLAITDNPDVSGAGQKENAELLRILKEITVERLELSNATLAEAVEYLRGRHLADGESKFGGIDFLVRCERTILLERADISANNISLFQALRLLPSKYSITVYLEKGCVVIE